jgi:hypothetical protein
MSPASKAADWICVEGECRRVAVMGGALSRDLEGFVPAVEEQGKASPAAGEPSVGWIQVVASSVWCRLLSSPPPRAWQLTGARALPRRRVRGGELGV